MNCQEIPLVKNYLFGLFDKSDTLKQAISSTRSDFKEDAIPSIYDLIYNNIFPYKYPRTLENIQKTILSICVDLGSRPTLRDGSLDIYIYTHVDLMNTDYNITRNDYIVCRIEELLNDSMVKGVMSEISFVDTRELPPVKDWCVNLISYKFTSLNFDFVEVSDSYK